MNEALNLRLFALIRSETPNWINHWVVIVAEYAIFLVPAFFLVMWLKESFWVRKNLIFACLSALVSLLINALIAHYYYHPRPFVMGFSSLITHTPDSSFPSDHVSVIAAVAWAFWLKKYRPFDKLFMILALAVGLSRVVAGVHFPMDVAGAVYTSLVATLLMSFVWLRFGTKITQSFNQLSIILLTR